MPVGKVGRVVVFKEVAAYALDRAAGALVEKRFDGDTAAYPLAGPGPEDAANAARDAAGALVIEGRAAADLIVVVDGERAVALARPLPGGKRRHRFEVTLTYLPANLRIFALGDGLAREIIPTLTTP
jgi:hypothetical protein